MSALRRSVRAAISSRAVKDLSRARPIGQLLILTLLVVVIAAPIRFQLPIGPFRSASLLDLVVFIGGVFLLIRFLARNSIRVGDTRIFALVLVPLFVNVVSLFWTQDYAATLRSQVVFVELAMAYLLVVNVMHFASATTQLRFTTAASFGIIVVALLMWLRIPGFEPYATSEIPQADLVSYYARFSHPHIGRSNNLASALALFLFPLLGAWLIRRKAMFAISTAAVFFALILTLSRGVILAVLLCLVVLAVRFGSVVGARLGIVIVLSALSLYGLVESGWNMLQPLAQHLSRRFDVAQLSMRSDLTGAALDLINRRPLLGYGGGTNPDASLASFGGFHNAYLAMWVHYGVPLGTVAIASLILIAHRFYRAGGLVVNQRTGPFAFVLGTGIVCQLLIFLSQTSFEAATLRILFGMGIGIYVSLLRSLPAEETAARWQPRKFAARGPGGPYL